MKKIHTILEYEMKLNPNRIFNVLIVLNEGEAAESLALSNYTIIMENIIASSLSAAQIYSLEKKDTVIAIELDQEIKNL